MFDGGRPLESVTTVPFEYAKPKTPSGVDLTGLAESASLNAGVLSPIARMGTPEARLEIRLSLG